MAPIKWFRRFRRSTAKPEGEQIVNTTAATPTSVMAEFADQANFRRRGNNDEAAASVRSPEPAEEPDLPSLYGNNELSAIATPRLQMDPPPVNDSPGADASVSNSHENGSARKTREKNQNPNSNRLADDDENNLAAVEPIDVVFDTVNNTRKEQQMLNSSGRLSGGTENQHPNEAPEATRRDMENNKPEGRNDLDDGMENQKPVKASETVNTVPRAAAKLSAEHSKKTSSSSSSSSISVGQRVKIISKQDHGKVGTVVRMVRKGTAAVELEHNGGLVNKRITSLQPVVTTNADSSPSASTLAPARVASAAAEQNLPSPRPDTISVKATSSIGNNNSIDNFVVGQRVLLTSKEHSGARGVILERVKKGTYKIQLDGARILTNKRWTSLQPIIKTVESSSSESSVDIHHNNAVNVGLVLQEKVMNDAHPDAACPPESLEELPSAHKTSEETELTPSSNSSNSNQSTRRSFFSMRESGHSSPFAVGMTVRVVRGNHKDKTGRITALKGKKTFTVDIPGIGSVDKRKTSIQQIGDSTLEVCTAPITVNNEIADGKGWQVEDCDRGGTRFGSRQIVKLRISRPKGANKEHCFLTHLLGDRILIVETPLNKDELDEPLETCLEYDNCKYELLSTKVQADGESGTTKYCSKMCLRQVYGKVSGPRLAPIPIQETLLGISDFANLKPRKVMARLELMQSPAYVFPKTKKPAIFFLKDSAIGFVPYRGQAGCGTMSVDFFMERILGYTNTTGYSLEQAKKLADRLLGLQIRLFGPSVGTFKGMLALVRIRSGPPIQLNASMQKVEPSKYPGMFDGVCLVVTKNGLHPNSTTNEYIGRMLDPSLKPPPPKSFKVAIKKPLSEMVLRLWRSLDVPKEVCDDYKKKSLLPAHRQHAWLIGLADPTGTLPKDHIFVTGMKSQQQAKLFVTRSPCTKPDHGRMLPVVTTKPEGMSDDDWKWFNELPFGGIFFADPPKGMLSIPERISSGDLDGDLYLVCWNEQVLAHIKAIRMEDESEPIETSAPPSDDPDDGSWFTKAQELMVDVAAEQEMGALMGKLYTLLGKIADESSLYNPDSMALSEAFDQALEFRKHGRAIKLPAHLHEKLPAALRHHVTAK